MKKVEVFERVEHLRATGSKFNRDRLVGPLPVNKPGQPQNSRQIMAVVRAERTSQRRIDTAHRGAGLWRGHVERLT